MLTFPLQYAGLLRLSDNEVTQESRWLHVRRDTREFGGKHRTVRIRRPRNNDFGHGCLDVNRLFDVLQQLP